MAEVAGAAASTTVDRSLVPPEGVVGPSADRPGTPASIDQSIKPDDLGRPPWIILDAEEAMPGVVEESACDVGDVLVDLTPSSWGQSRCRPTQSSTELLGSLDAEVGMVLPAPFCLPWSKPSGHRSEPVHGMDLAQAVGEKKCQVEGQ